MTWTFLHGHFNNCLPIPVLKQYVNSSRQNGFSNDSACMYDKKMHVCAWDFGGPRSKDLNSHLRFFLLADFGVKADLETNGIVLS